MSTALGFAKKFGVFVVLAALPWSVGACRSDQGKRVVVFVQATKDSQVNQKIMEQYGWPIFRVLEQSGEPFQVDMYAITGHTAGSTAFYSATVMEGATQTLERNAAKARFLKLRQVLDQTYGEEGSQLVDILGSLQVLDDALGSLPKKEPLYVIYVSDMIQSNGADGYDFTGFYGGKSLEYCRQHLGEEVAAKLLHKDKFSSARVLVLKLDLQSLFREKGTESEPPPPNLRQIDNFWQHEVFEGLLRVKQYQVDRSKDPRRSIQQILG